MAEVQRRLESITIEIEELSRIGIFSDEECTKVVKRQFEYENKINSMNKSLQDFKEYICYVVSLFKLIKVRRHKLKVSEKKHNLEYKILQRIKNLYEMAATRYSNDIGIFLSFCEFCKEAACLHASKTMCDMFIKHHPINEEAWLNVSQLWYSEKDPGQAIKLLQQGIGMVNKSNRLYLECIRYELINGAKEIPTNFTNEHIELVKKLAVYIKLAKKHVEGYDFFMQLLVLLDQYNFTSSLQVDVIQHSLDHYQNNVDMWNCLASRELFGIHIDLENKQVSKVSSSEAIVNSGVIFEQGIANVPKYKKMALWELYLDSILSIQGDARFEKINNYVGIANTVFEKAASKNYLSQKYFLEWMKLVNEKRRFEILKLANEKLPQSAELWDLRLRIALVNEEDPRTIFADACSKLGDDAGVLWQTIHDFYAKDIDGMNEFYASVMQQNTTLANSFKAKYIGWLSHSKDDAKKSREFYRQIAEAGDLCWEMYDAMQAIEAEKNDSNEAFVDWMHKQACRQFGGKTVTVWLNYIEYLMKKKRIVDAKDAVALVVVDALAALEGDRKTQFKDGYDSIMLQYNSKRQRTK